MKREACEFVEFSKMVPSPFANSTFFKLVFLLTQASKCFVFGQKSVVVMCLAAEVSEFSL